VSHNYSSRKENVLRENNWRECWQRSRTSKGARSFVCCGWQQCIDERADEDPTEVKMHGLYTQYNYCEHVGPANDIGNTSAFIVDVPSLVTGRHVINVTTISLQ
jgi:hypothetical protein